MAHPPSPETRSRVLSQRLAPNNKQMIHDGGVSGFDARVCVTQPLFSLLPMHTKSNLILSLKPCSQQTTFVDKLEATTRIKIVSKAAGDKVLWQISETGHIFPCASAMILRESDRHACTALHVVGFFFNFYCWQLETLSQCKGTIEATQSMSEEKLFSHG
jgi:hypothetical protein